MKVLVTGFGPFREHETNASWIAVKTMNESGGLGDVDNVKLFVKEVPVEYSVVDKLVPQLIKKHSPHLVVHVGVSGIAKVVTLESCAHNSNYTNNDISGKTPKNGFCRKNLSEECLKSKLCMHTIAEKVSSNGKTKVVTSENAGRYLCEYIYYTSLFLCKCPVAFVHVPRIDEHHTKESLANTLRQILIAMIDDIRLKNGTLRA